MATKTTPKDAAVAAADAGAATVEALRQLIGGVSTKEQDKAWTSIATTIKHEGKQIILPNDPLKMSYDAAIQTLERIKKEEAQVFDVHEVIQGLPWDAAVAIYRAMQELYGVVTSSTKMTWFGPVNPQYLSVKTGPFEDDVIQVPIGQLQIPGTDAKFELGIQPGMAYIVGKVNKADRARLVEIAQVARKIILTDSIYRGKAIKIHVDDDGDLDMQNQPEFIDLSGVSKSDMIHPELVTELINVNIFSPLENTAACRKNRIPLKRGILMEGKYGTGKSLTALVTAKVATDNGWGFIMLDSCTGLEEGLQYSKSIQPVVIFTEDIDRNSDRDVEQVNQLVNTLDGVDTKTNEVMVVLTTNFVERIDKALLRPGRFDAIISLVPPDAVTAEKLVRKYAGPLLDPKEDLKKAGEYLDKQVPASIREVVERAKLAMLQRGAETINSKDLEVQAFGMKQHFELLADKVIMETPKDKLWGAMGALIAEHGVKPGVTDQVDAMQTNLESICQKFGLEAA